MKYYKEIKGKIKTFLIEMPELNLHPVVQDKLIQYFVENTSTFGSGVLLTTQSPYTLTSLNNMMYGYEMGQKNEGQTSEIIEKKYWLNPKEVTAYRLLSDGTARNILDDELKQIDAGELDEISRSINAKWDKIADIEFGKCV